MVKSKNSSDTPQRKERASWPTKQCRMYREKISFPKELNTKGMATQNKPYLVEEGKGYAKALLSTVRGYLNYNSREEPSRHEDNHDVEEKNH